ncbi:hypothetical protein T265_12400 [Opisthorchis viverrini]|uniref:Uncharacterized protein n=1 Tax=Opisthorchis viverrini TaxID=6198 RepID=A0A074YTF4_OPIVI|nr:hypothetical protein T265_12400 [Opisthorchis viverrini]KER18008.1 hypothetical protein T265_12400 [Opisthorchis viverrini]
MKDTGSPKDDVTKASERAKSSQELCKSGEKITRIKEIRQLAAERNKTQCNSYFLGSFSILFFSVPARFAATSPSVASIDLFISSSSS